MVISIKCLMTIIDMHMHLRYRSRCSKLSPSDINDNLSHRFDAICITDHWVMDPLKNNPFNHNLQVFYGIEISCDFGDILAYGIQWIPLRRRMIKAEYIIDYIHKQDGIAICAHPFSNRHEGFGEYIYEFDFDAIEINGALDKEFNNKAKKAAEEMDLPTIGGSDAHSMRQLNTIGTQFGVPINSLSDIIKAVKDKKCKDIVI